MKELASTLRHVEWLVELMTAQRDEAFKHLTKAQQRECVVAASQAVRPQTVALIASERPDPDLGGDYAAEWKDGEPPQEPE